MSKAEFLIHDLPDPASASRFLEQFADKHPSNAAKLSKNEALLSDVLTLVSYSTLLATTLLQNPEYIWWLNRKRLDSQVRNKEELLESLARFSLTHSQPDIQVLLARFRRRELLRIYLRDIRRLATIAEITEEISNLADAVLEHALRTARQELDNRYGNPLETDEKGRQRPAGFCIVALGKLGSKELNYSSDIDLLFIYSKEGSTSGQGTKGSLTNREYFVKLAEQVTKVVGQQAGEGAAYRIDLRLRPRGSIGAIALSLEETTRYYRSEARSWERQVLIRSRAAAGDLYVFKKFYSNVENSVFSAAQTVDKALSAVRISKEKIDVEIRDRKGYNVKLGAGGIREIEFIAQALQLAYGGRDKWLRSPHTLISLTRLADRELLTESELTGLFEAYEFLRHLEHILQMEDGLQIHTLPEDREKRLLVAKRMQSQSLKAFERDLAKHTGNVHRIFGRVFAEVPAATRENSDLLDRPADEDDRQNKTAKKKGRIRSAHDLPPELTASFAKSGIDDKLNAGQLEIIAKLSQTSPNFTGILAASPHLALDLPELDTDSPNRNYSEILTDAVGSESDFRHQLAAFRKSWSRMILEIAVYDAFEKLPLKEIKQLQTQLAEASIEAGLFITTAELASRLNVEIGRLPLAVLGLGKLGGGGVDYESDLDLVLVYDDANPLQVSDITQPEFYSRAVEIFITTLSSMTRNGSLYRIDLRLRPYGKNGASSNSATSFIEYFQNSAAIWELLAFVKLRGVGGDLSLARCVETELRALIHRQALTIDVDELRNETKRVRLLLEHEKAKQRRGDDIDIKYGSGGMLDIYFAMRFLQLRDNVPDDEENRSTDFMLNKLLERRSLTAEDHSVFSEGYRFLSALDHNIRLTVGRTTRLPAANLNALQIIAKRMNLARVNDLLGQLTVHRLNIRSVFERVLAG